MSARAQQLPQLDVADAARQEPFVDDRIVRQHVAAEGDEQAGDLLADAPGADDAGGGTVQPSTEQPVEGEVAVADRGSGRDGCAGPNPG